MTGAEMTCGKIRSPVIHMVFNRRPSLVGKSPKRVIMACSVLGWYGSNLTRSVRPCRTVELLGGAGVAEHGYGIVVVQLGSIRFGSKRCDASR